MRKKTALQNPKNPKASPPQPSGLVPKGHQPSESAKRRCALDNRSHRTFRRCRRGLRAAFSGANKVSEGGNLFDIGWRCTDQRNRYSRSANSSALYPQSVSEVNAAEAYSRIDQGKCAPIHEGPPVVAVIGEWPP